MNLKRSLAICALLLCLIGLAVTFVPRFILGYLGMPRRYHAATSSAYAQTKTHHVVFTVTSEDEADWKLTLGNMGNLLKSFGEDPYEVELVAFGPGIAIIKKPSTVASDIEAMQAKHVHFKACENSMRGRKLTVADLVPGAEPVPAGIVEVVTKQEQGWAYIKGGR